MSESYLLGAQMDKTTANQPLGYEPLPRPLRLADQRWPEGTHPLVSICCITYNHASFICDAINGFLMQETTFPVEILIHDDASEDGTQEVIRSYVKRYPNLFRAIYQSSNQYSQGKRPGARLRELAQGDFIACCEGDDYWTDPRKLAIQSAYLQAHPSVVATCHLARIVDTDGNVVRESKTPAALNSDAAAVDLRKGYFAVLNTLLFRNVIGPIPPEFLDVKNGDTALISQLGEHGSLHFHPEIGSTVQRLHNGGVWGPLAEIDRGFHRAHTYARLYQYQRRRGDEEVATYFIRAFISLHRLAIRQMVGDRQWRELLSYGQRLLRQLLRMRSSSLCLHILQYLVFTEACNRIPRGILRKIRDAVAPRAYLRR